MAVPQGAPAPSVPRRSEEGGATGPLADPALRAGLLLLRWLLIAAVAMLSLTAPPTQHSAVSPIALVAVFAAYSAVVSLAQFHRPRPILGPLRVALLDVLVLGALVRTSGSPDAPLTFLFPLAIVTVLLHFPTLPGVFAVGGVVAAAALSVVTQDTWRWARTDLPMVGLHAALLIGVAVPVALLARHLRGRDEEMERHRFLAARLHLLNELMKAAAGAELDVQRAARTVAEVARDAVGGDAGVVALREDGDGSGVRVWTAAHGRLEIAGPDVTPALRRALAGKPELVADAASVPYAAVYAATGLRSWVAAPLVLHGQPFGAVLVGSRLPRSYLTAAQEWLTTIAEQAALPLANAREHTREKAFAARVAALERTKSDFLLTASHELRTPLAALKITAGLLAEQAATWPEPARARKLLAGLQRNTDRLERLVDELLDMARLQSGALALQREPADIVAALQEAAAALRPLTDAHQQQVVIEAADSPCIAPVDQRRLDQVFANLLANAQKYSPAGAVIRASAHPLDGGVLVRIQDEAPGIPDEERDRIFEAFYRGPGQQDSRPGGLGLGLAIAKGIVELHGGRIWVERSSERGNTFAVFLPREDGATEVDPRCTS